MTKHARLRTLQGKEMRCCVGKKKKRKIYAVSMLLRFLNSFRKIDARNVRYFESYVTRRNYQSHEIMGFNSQPVASAALMMVVMWLAFEQYR